MATNDKLLNAIKEVGDLRESIGAARVKFDAEKAKLDTMQANLEAMERDLAAREKALDALVRVSWTPERKARVPRVAAPPPTPQPKVTAPPPKVATTTPPAKRKRRFSLRGNSLAARIVELLNATPTYNFTAAELATRLGVDIRQMYGTLSRLATKYQMIERVSDGVFRAARKEGATAAA